MADNGFRNVLPIKQEPGKMTAVTSNVGMVSADTEYEYALPAGTKKFAFKLRDATTDAKLNIGKVSGESDSNYMYIPPNGHFSEDSLNTDEGTKLYFQSPSSSQIAEIIAWV